jgi:CO/xanthine dehydrogenase FAD-binding subunit
VNAAVVVELAGSAVRRAAIALGAVTPVIARAQAAERWLASWAAPGVADPASLRPLPATVAADPQLRRGEAYLCDAARHLSRTKAGNW